jgi:hypothetical protein
MQEFSDKTAPYQIPFEAYGIHVRICTNSPELLERIKPMLPPGWTRRPRSSTQKRLGLLEEDNGIYSMYSDAICIHDSPGKEYALMMMDAQIQAYVALESPNFIFVHAGVVGDGDRAIVLPGSTFSGKSTLVRALLAAGAVYYSDEYAAIDEAGLVHPYPVALSVRPSNGGPQPSAADPESAWVSYPAEQLGAVTGSEPLPIGVVAVTRYRPGTDWQPLELSAGAGALAMLEHTVPAQTRPKQALRVLTKAVNGALVLEGKRGEAEEVADLLLTLRAAA